MDPSHSLERVAAFFDRRTTRQAWVARRAVGRTFRSDDELRAQLIGKAGGALSRAGGLKEPVVVVGLLEDLVDLEAPPEALGPAVTSLLALGGRPGAFGEGCTAARHNHRVCEHFIGGFFSPAPPTQRVAPVTLPNGRAYRIESQARFAVSCWILQVVLRAGQVGDPSAVRHLDSFTNLLEVWEAWDDMLHPDLAFGAAAALAAAPERWRSAQEALVRLIGNHQLPDGTWPRVDFFTALDGLSRVNDAVARPLLERAVPGLLQRQREDGSFGSVALDDRALIGLRVLLRVGARLDPEPARG
ncbi:MAG: hypothetical protein AB7L66_08960 [Gemmatimonadales bacterium]